MAYEITMENDISYIKIYDVEQNEDFCSLYLHNNIIHEIEWHMSEKFILTASSDQSMKIFKLPETKIFD